MESDYIAARKQGIREMRQAAAEKRSPYPAVLDDIIKGEGKLAEVSIGLLEIPISMIDGTKTEGRTSAFSCGFMPILQSDTEFARKWADLYDSQLEEGIRDPIKAYEYMTRFYVEEGNKRVSVSSFVGATAIHANVIRVMPKKADTKEYRVYREFLEYFNVCRMYDVTFTEEGSYRKFASCLGQTLDKPWPKEVQEDIKAAYAAFSEIYRHAGEKRRMTLPVGDAFLTYLNFYPVQSLFNEPRQILENRIGRLWNEFLVDANEDGITLVETPEELREEKGTLGTALRGILTPKARYSTENPLHMAFIYPKSADDSGWIYGHELGRNYIESRFGGLVKTEKYENCSSDEEVRKAIDQAASHHAEMIFTISPTQMDETLRSAIHFPQVKFLNCSINLSHNAVRTYYGRMHEAKFLMGAIAASVASNHKIGYVADYPIYGIVAGINAFAIGASIIDPKARIHLKWSTNKDTDWRQELDEEGVYVISGPDFIRPAQASREYGIYQKDIEGNVTNLAAPMWNWGTYYELIARNVLEGNWDVAGQSAEDRSTNYWWGMSAGVIDVILSEKLSYSSRKLVNLLRDGIVEGHVSPFMGELHSQEGMIRDASSRGLSNTEIITMSWLNDNVIGSIPKKERLNEEAGAAVAVSGVSSVTEGEETTASAGFAAAGHEETAQEAEAAKNGWTAQ